MNKHGLCVISSSLVTCARSGGNIPLLQAEQLRSKAQRPEQSRQHTQLCRYLYYLGRIRAITLDYTDAKDCFQQAARKVRASVVLGIWKAGSHQGWTAQQPAR